MSPILWRNEDIPDLMPPIDAAQLVDEMASVGVEGVEYSSLFPTDAAEVRQLLEPRGLRLVSTYVALRLPEGDLAEQVSRACERARFVRDADGDVLVCALDYEEWRLSVAGSVGSGDPRLDENGWTVVTEALDAIGRCCSEIGIELAFHNEAGTFIETAGEFAELARRTDASLVNLCLDVGHLTVGGGDAAPFFREHRARIRHVHLKDANRHIVEGMRRREFGMMEALRRGIFCELGAGALDIAAFVRELVDCGYDRWIVLEQDSTSGRPLDAALRNRETFRRLAGI